MILKSKSSLADAILQVCSLWADERSKDPSTKVGACVYDPRTGGLFLGYNGFSAGVADEEEVWSTKKDLGTDNFCLTKYDLVVHAEVNAVRKALMGGVDLANATLFCTHIPCTECMKNVVLANSIHYVTYLHDSYGSRTARDNFVVAQLAERGGVTLEKLKTYFDGCNEALAKLEK